MLIAKPPPVVVRSLPAYSASGLFSWVVELLDVPSAWSMPRWARTVRPVRRPAHGCCSCRRVCRRTDEGAVKNLSGVSTGAGRLVPQRIPYAHARCRLTSGREVSCIEARLAETRAAQGLLTPGVAGRYAFRPRSPADLGGRPPRSPQHGLHPERIDAQPTVNRGFAFARQELGVRDPSSPH
jgi:hypothetical protein